VISGGGKSRRSADVTAYDPNNIFARILRGELPCHRLYETEHVLAFMDIMPRAPGHCLVIPKVAARTLLDVPTDALAHLAAGVQTVARAVKAGMLADGLTIQQFNESAGGQVVFHVHVHIIPRWEGVAMKPHTSEMAQGEQLSENAARIRAALAA
jgi:histidine triad (HIT) family protein